MIIRKAKKDNLKKIDEIYVNGSILEGKLQFPKVSINEKRFRKVVNLKES